MLDPTEKAKAKNELDNMEIQSVGLVPKGANKIPSFILLKSENKEATMPDNVTIEEVPNEQHDETLLKRFVAEVGKLFQSREPAQSEATTAPAATVPASPPPAQPNENIEKLLKAQADSLQAIFKAENEKLEKRIVEAEEKVKKAEEEAALAKQYADGQTERAERQAMLQKALEFKALPVKPVDMGDLLYNLQKSLTEEDYTKLDALLKAADKQAWTAGLFAEVGTARTPEQATLEDKVEKAAKESGDPVAALLSLPPEEQARLSKEWDEEVS